MHIMVTCKHCGRDCGMLCKAYDPAYFHGTHITHCCARHGCKYGDEDCVVATGQSQQADICEECETDPEPTLESLIKARDVADEALKAYLAKLRANCKHPNIVGIAGKYGGVGERLCLDCGTVEKYSCKILVASGKYSSAPIIPNQDFHRIKCSFIYWNDVEWCDRGDDGQGHQVKRSDMYWEPGDEYDYGGITSHCDACKGKLSPGLAKLNRSKRG